MILRRLTRHVEDQNWFAVALDFLIVVCGVYFGIALGNWNEARQDRARAESFRALMYEDLGVQHDLSLQHGIYYDDVLRAALDAHYALTGTRPLSDRDLLIAAFRATQIDSSSPPRAAYDELVSSGQLSLLTREERDFASQVFSDTLNRENLTLQRAAPFRLLYRRRVDPRVALAVEGACGDRFGLLGPATNTALSELMALGDDAFVFRSVTLAPINEGRFEAPRLDYPCDPDITEEQARASAEALRDDPDALPALRERISQIVSVSGPLWEQAKFIEETLRRRDDLSGNKSGTIR